MRDQLGGKLFQICLRLLNVDKRCMYTDSMQNREEACLHLERLRGYDHGSRVIGLQTVRNPCSLREYHRPVV